MKYPQQRPKLLNPSFVSNGEPYVLQGHYHNDNEAKFFNCTEGSHLRLKKGNNCFVALWKISKPKQTPVSFLIDPVNGTKVLTILYLCEFKDNDYTIHKSRSFVRVKLLSYTLRQLAYLTHQLGLRSIEIDIV